MTSLWYVDTACFTNKGFYSFHQFVLFFLVFIASNIIEKINVFNIEEKNYFLACDPSQNPSGFCVLPQPHFGRLGMFYIFKVTSSSKLLSIALFPRLSKKEFDP